MLWFERKHYNTMLDGSRCGKTYKTNLRTHHLELTTPRTMPTRRIKDIYRVCYINLPHGNLLFASLSSPFISLVFCCCHVVKYVGLLLFLWARVFCQLFLLKKSSAIATASSLTIVAIVELRQLLRPSADTLAKSFTQWRMCDGELTSERKTHLDTHKLVTLAVLFCFSSVNLA